MTKLNPATGATIATYQNVNNPQNVCFDGANIWTANYADGTVTKM
jgi:hypothetical protein